MVTGLTDAAVLISPAKLVILLFGTVVSGVTVEPTLCFKTGVEFKRIVESATTGVAAKLAANSSAAY